MAPYIYTERNGIYIVDLQKTVRKLEEAYSFVRQLSESGQSLLFVGTKKQAQEAIKEEATRCGQYYVNARWLGGMMTNFKTMRTRVDRLNQLKAMQTDGTFDMLPKKEVMKHLGEIEKLEKYLGGVKDMKKLPGALFIVDTRKERNAIAEAHKLGIPVVAIGGIVPADIPAILRTGVSGVAISSTILGSPDPAATTREIINLINNNLHNPEQWKNL